MIRFKKNNTRKTSFLSKKYNHFVTLIIISICAAYSLLLTAAYYDHKSVYNKKSLSLTRIASYNFERILSQKVLESNIDFDYILKEVHGEIQDKKTQITILNIDNQIFKQTESGLLSKDLFNSIDCKNDGNISIKSKNSIYLSYQKVHNYPFCLVVGFDKEVFYYSLKRTFIQYFLILSIITIILLIIFSSFYKTIISPINQIAIFARQILSHDFSKPYPALGPQACDFAEINSLNQIISKVGDFQHKLKETNYRLYEAYKLRYETQTKQNSSRGLNSQEIVQKIIKILYPEIYSKNLDIKQEYKAQNSSHIDGQVICDILLPVIARSCLFSMKNKVIKINFSDIELNKAEYLQIVVQDEGIGNEEWRSKNVDDEEFLRAKRIIQENDGLLYYQENKGYGVKYYILLPSNKRALNDNIVKLF